MKLKILFLLFILPILLFGKDLFIEAALQENISDKKSRAVSSIGFEYFKKFANDYGDFLTADLQVRIPYNLDDEFPESLTLELHSSWLEYKAGLGKFIRLGHFAPAFGMETITDTHGTLAQTLAMKNVGFKQDWGIGFRSFIGSFDYFLAATSGSGMALREEGFLFSGRMSSSTLNDLQYAVSMLYGDVHNTMNMATYPVKKSMGIITKKRVTVEIQYNFSSYTFRNELSAGYNDESEIFSNFAEFEFNPFTRPEFSFKLQNKYFDNSTMNTTDWFTGISYQFFGKLTFSMLYDLSQESLHIKLYFFG